ncbi:nucleotide exchange factor GrpE [Reinekea sp.]|jgi:molecular chaperone GrpE|uniref:nucleotide exchange factor GrpE n=1 Tax=Reinekea sp. TaxID=1970455 RepID=UPI003989719E
MSNEERPVDEQLENEAVEEQLEAAGSTETPESGDLAEQLALAQEEAAKYKDQFIRSEAEMANLRRRVEKDVENAHKFGQEKISKELLSVADNLERAILASDSDSAEVIALKEGVKLTLKGLLDVFAKFNINAVDPQGEPFDPQLHQAMSMVENPDVEPNTVIAVMQKGYTLYDRLIRPAMVMVSKGGEKSTTIDEKA